VQVCRCTGRPDRHAPDTLRLAIHHPQLFLPGGTFHTSRLDAGASYALLASTEWPGVEPPDVEHGDIEALMKDFPDFREEIQAFTPNK
jgi:hypothetical protein